MKRSGLWDKTYSSVFGVIICAIYKKAPSASLALARTNHIPAWVPERPRWDPKRGLKKVPRSSELDPEPCNLRSDADPWFTQRRQKIERIKDQRDDPDVWICDLWEPQTHSRLFLCDGWTFSEGTGTFLFPWEDIRCYSKGYCRSWIHWGLKNAKHLFSELLGTEPRKVGLIQHFSFLLVKRNLLVILAVMSYVIWPERKMVCSECTAPYIWHVFCLL